MNLVKLQAKVMMKPRRGTPAAEDPWGNVRRGDGGMGSIKKAMERTGLYYYAIVVT